MGCRILVPTAAMAEGVAPVGNDASAAKTRLLRAAQREALMRAFHSCAALKKPMDLSSWLGANRSDAQWHREDLQRRQGGKGAVLCAA